MSGAIPMIARCRRLQSPPGAPDITGATVEIDRTALRVQTDSTGANIYPVLSLYEDCVMRWGLGPEGKWFSTRL